MEETDVILLWGSNARETHPIFFHHLLKGVRRGAVRAERSAWYFYRVKWGSQDEFVDLFQKNHYPVLKAQIKTGRIASVRAYVPTYHGDGRADWTFAVSITYKDTAAMTGPSAEAEISRQLYPDQATFRKEEQRRFEIPRRALGRAAERD